MEIIYTKYFIKQYKKLPKDIQEKFGKRVVVFMVDHDNSSLNIHRLRGALKGYYSFNVNSDYRVIYKYKGEIVAIFSDFGTHSQLYK